MNQIILKIYLKKHRRPFVVVTLSKESHLEEFMNLLNSPNENIRFYNIIFNKSEFSHATVEYK